MVARERSFGNVKADVIAARKSLFHRGNCCNVIRCSPYARPHPDAAGRVVARIVSVMDNLANHPAMGVSAAVIDRWPPFEEAILHTIRRD